MRKRMARVTVALAIAATVDAFVSHRMLASSGPELKVKQARPSRRLSSSVLMNAGPGASATPSSNSGSKSMKVKARVLSLLTAAFISSSSPQMSQASTATQAAPHDVSLASKESGDGTEFTRLPSVVSWNTNTHRAAAGSPAAASISPSPPALDASCLPSISNLQSIALDLIIAQSPSAGPSVVSSGLSEPGRLDRDVLQKMIREAEASLATTQGLESEEHAALGAPALEAPALAAHPSASIQIPVERAGTADSGPEATDAKSVPDSLESTPLSARVRRWSLFAASSIAAGFYSADLLDIPTPLTASTGDQATLNSAGGAKASARALGQDTSRRVVSVTPSAAMADDGVTQESRLLSWPAVTFGSLLSCLAIGGWWIQDTTKKQSKKQLKTLKQDSRKEIEEEVKKMRAVEIKEELSKRGVSYEGLFEKSEFVAKLVQARERLAASPGASLKSPAHGGKASITGQLRASWLLAADQEQVVAADAAPVRGPQRASVHTDSETVHMHPKAVAPANMDPRTVAQVHAPPPGKARIVLPFAKLRAIEVNREQWGVGAEVPTKQVSVSEEEDAKIVKSEAMEKTKDKANKETAPATVAHTPTILTNMHQADAEALPPHYAQEDLDDETFARGTAQGDNIRSRVGDAAQVHVRLGADPRLEVEAPEHLNEAAAAAALAAGVLLPAYLTTPGLAEGNRHEGESVTGRRIGTARRPGERPAPIQTRGPGNRRLGSVNWSIQK